MRSQDSALSGSRDPEDPPGSALRQPLFWLALTLGATRFWRLGEWSLWIDEVYTLCDLWTLDDGIPDNEPKNPLGYLLFSWTLGDAHWPTPLQLRVLPAVFGWLGIAITGVAFAKFVGPRRSSLAALVLALSPFHLYWSQTARAYTLTQVLVLLGGLLVLSALADRAPSRRAPLVALGGLGLCALAALAHISAALAVPAWIAAALLVRTDPATRVRWALTGAGVLGLAALPWVAGLVADYVRSKAGFSTPHLVLTSGWYFGPALLGLAALGGVRAWRAGVTVERWILVMVLVATLAGLAASLQIRAAAKYLFFLLPWLAVLATGPLLPATPARGPAPGRAWRAIGSAVLLLPLLIDSAHYFLARHGERPRWREAFAYVWNERGPGDLIVSNQPTVGEYYLAPGQRDLRAPLAVLKLDAFKNRGLRTWDRKGRPIWVVLNEELLLDWSAVDRDAIRAVLTEEYEEVARFPVPWPLRDLDVLVFRQASATTP